MGFGRLARVYATLERLVYGRLLERVRAAQMAEFVAADEVLLLGDGDGRFLEAMLVARAKAGAGGRVVSVDGSARMLERARERVAGLPGAGGVSFVASRIEAFEPPAGFAPTAVGAHFVLDCFSDRELGEVIGKVGKWGAPGAVLIFSDFSELPEGHCGRVPARVLLGVMYRFFRVATGLRVTRLPNFHKALTRNHWERVRGRAWWGGFLVSQVWRRGGGGGIL